MDSCILPEAFSVEETKVEENSLEDCKCQAKPAPQQENSAAKAKKFAEKVRFRLKESMAQRGGSEAFLHWLQSNSEKKA